MTPIMLSPAERVLAVCGLAYALAITEKMPGHWLRPLFRNDLAELLERLAPEDGSARFATLHKALSAARRLVGKLKIPAVEDSNV